MAPMKTVASVAMDPGLAQAVAGASAFFAWLWQDVPIAVFGVPFSVLLAGFAGAMAIVSFMPPFATRRKMWITVLVCTLAAGYLTRIALKLAHWNMEYALGMAFGVGFTFQVAGQLLVQNGGKILDAAVSRLRGGPR